MLGFAFAVLLLVAIAASLYVTESVLDIWDSLQSKPTWLIATIFSLLAIISLFSCILLLKLLLPKRTKTKHHKALITSKEALDDRLNQAVEDGLDVKVVKEELNKLAERRAAGKIYLSMFGEVNMGKSSIIRAILPDANITTSNIAGTTRKITHYCWQSSAGDQLILADVPGTEQVDSALLLSLARAEALRAHIVIYVCDGDMSRTQHQELQLLYELNKPIIIVLNKSDVYCPEELQAIYDKLTSQLPNNTDTEIVTISSKKETSVIRVHANGSEETVTTEAETDVAALVLAIQKMIDNHESTLEQLRDAAVFSLAASYIDDAEATQQHEKAQEVVTQYTKRAVIGALATVSPGTDLIVQAYLGTSMVRAVCEIYRIPVRDFDIDTLLKLIQAQVGKSTPVILAIVGNGLKAFPGIGTLAGGLVHATAYGLIFDTLGKTLVRTLSSRGEFRPAVTARVFQETLNENMEKGTANFVKIVLAARKKSDDNRS